MTAAHPPPHFTLDQLVVLEAIDRHGSFVGAARALHRVPSAVTYAVTRLEEAVGVPLFTRSAHQARLTPAGQRVLEESRAVLEHARRLDRVAQSLKAGWEPVLSVVIDGVHPLEPVMRAVASFNALGVPTRVRIHVEYQSGVAARFDSDAADLMLMLEFDGTGAWEAVTLPDLPMDLLVAPTHPLAAAGEVDRDTLRAHVELVVRDSAPAFVETPRPSWFGCNQVVLLADFHSKLTAIRAGAGFGWLPRWMAAPHLESGALVRVPFPGGDTWTYRPHIVSRRDLPLGRAGQAFLGALLAELRVESYPAP
jgi:DNA-binding transcriptional LysR family regulator